MAIVNSSGTCINSTGSTATQVPLSGKAQWIYFTPYSQCYIKLAGNTNSSGTGTGLGLLCATGDTYAFQVQPGDARYLYYVATGTEPYYITEIF